MSSNPIQSPPEPVPAAASAPEPEFVDPELSASEAAPAEAPAAEVAPAPVPTPTRAPAPIAVLSPKPAPVPGDHFIEAQDPQQQQQRLYYDSTVENLWRLAEKRRQKTATKLILLGGRYEKELMRSTKPSNPESPWVNWYRTNFGQCYTGLAVDFVGEEPGFMLSESVRVYGRVTPTNLAKEILRDCAEQACRMDGRVNCDSAFDRKF